MGRAVSTETHLYLKQLLKQVLHTDGSLAFLHLFEQAQQRLRDRPRRVHFQVARPRSPALVAAHEANTLTADSEKELFTRYCVGCHNEKAKASGVDSSRKLTIDTIDFKDVRKHAEKLELIVRKMRAGMMPPVNARRPEPAVYRQMISWVEGELDRTATPFTPAPGPRSIT